MDREKRLVFQGNVDYKWIITISKEHQNGIGNIKYKRLFYLCLSFFPSFFVKCFALNALKIQPNQTWPEIRDSMAATHAHRCRTRS